MNFSSQGKQLCIDGFKSSLEGLNKSNLWVELGYTLSWDAYNESSDLSVQIELYQERFGFLPAKIYADKIYMNKKNRKLMKESEIQAMCKPLCSPPDRCGRKICGKYSAHSLNLPIVDF